MQNAAISVPHALRAEVDEALVHDVALVAGAEFAPLCAFFGGVVAQEVIKVTGKHVPLSQWLYMDALELLDKVCACTRVRLLARTAQLCALCAA